MPLHPYQCQACKHAFEEIQGLNEPPLTTCPACNKDSLTRLFGVPNYRVRGSPRCLGQLAEDNTRDLVKKHGKEGARQIIHEKTYGKGGRKLTLPKGASVVQKPTEVEIPWFRTGEVPGTGPRQEQPVDVTKIKDPVRYIKTGDKD